MDDLMTEYDVIVVGTGMTESILASALSRIGKTVLHMDSNEYYGENWASFNFDGIQNWIKKMNDINNNLSQVNSENVNENETVYTIDSRSNISNIEEKWYNNKNPESHAEELPLSSENENHSPGTCEESSDGKKETVSLDMESFIRKESRRFNLDLCPKVLFSRGPLVELLISSNIAKYAEFKSVSRVLTWRNECLELVPCSRADVFSTKNITVVEKRLLVKILTLFLKYPQDSEELSGFENKMFIEYLKYKKLPNNLIHYILYAMAMGDKTTPCLDGVKASKAFLESLGRYGNTPFIFPMYGSGELPQCFCRLCAVFGGVYYLKRGVEGIIAEGDKCVGIISENKRLSASTFVLSSNHIPADIIIKKDIIKISRGIFITDRNFPSNVLHCGREGSHVFLGLGEINTDDGSIKFYLKFFIRTKLARGTEELNNHSSELDYEESRSILQSEKEPLTLLLFPPISSISENSVTVMELGPGTNTCPEKVFVVHMTTLASKDSASDLKHVEDALFQTEGSSADSEKPKILWSLKWNSDHHISVVNSLQNVKICSGPSADLDYTFSINEAKRLFEEICPGEEFLPRAPDPDEIVLQMEENVEENQSQENAPAGLPPENGTGNISQESERVNPSPENAAGNLSRENAAGDIPRENASGNISQENEGENLSKLIAHEEE